jgi:hypothetical protein
MSSKVAPRSAAATPTIVSQSPSLVLSVPPTASSHSLLPQVHSSAFKHRFKAMLDKPRSSTFVVNVTIHELGNVPQLEGQFAVRWKFRGRRPHDADRLLEHPVERLVATEAKIMAKTNPVKLLRNSQSVRSLRTVSSIGTTPPSANWMVNRAIIPHTPHHAASLPVASHDSALYNSEMERKTTDLAPLCSGTPLDNEPHLIVDEPECMNGSRTTRHGTLASEGSLDLSSSMMHENETSTPQSGPSVRSSGLYQSGNSSTPSLVSIVQSISADKGSRVPSRASTRSDASGTKNGVNAFLSLAMDHDSMDRKGHTPTCAIRSHAVTWEYKVQHVLRIPLGKEVEVESSKHHSHKAGAGAKTTLPILGGGLLSESSLKLDIEQIDKRGENVKNPAGQSVLFGYVNIDLAPFADHGPVTRKFLLQNSKTNATIRVSCCAITG